MPKRYVILCNDDEFCLPIKAEWNPHTGWPREHSFLWGLPNFFGGAESGNEAAFNTMQREVMEESAGTADLFNVVANPVFRGTYPNRAGRPVQCEFFYSRLWQLRPWPTEEDWIELGQERGADYNEMCFVVRVPRRKFRRFMYEPLIYDFFNVIMEAAYEQAPQWAREQFRDEPTDEFVQSLTGRALTEFVMLWLNHRLPDELGHPHAQDARGVHGVPPGFPRPMPRSIRTI
jgi:hypothetical protein